MADKNQRTNIYCTSELAPLLIHICSHRRRKAPWLRSSSTKSYTLTISFRRYVSAESRYFSPPGLFLRISYGRIPSLKREARQLLTEGGFNALFLYSYDTFNIRLIFFIAFCFTFKCSHEAASYTFSYAHFAGEVSRILQKRLINENLSERTLKKGYYHWFLFNCKKNIEWKKNDKNDCVLDKVGWNCSGCKMSRNIRNRLVAKQCSWISVIEIWKKRQPQCNHFDLHIVYAASALQ